MANSNTFILLILWMIIIMIGTSNTGKSNTLFSIHMIFDNRHDISSTKPDEKALSSSFFLDGNLLGFLSRGRGKLSTLQIFSLLYMCGAAEKARRH